MMFLFNRELWILFVIIKQYIVLDLFSMGSYITMLYQYFLIFWGVWDNFESLVKAMDSSSPCHWKKYV